MEKIKLPLVHAQGNSQSFVGRKNPAIRSFPRRGIGISAVILSKNSADNIQKTLKSVDFCQELIIIDDNSSDNTKEIINKWGQKNPKTKVRFFSRNLNQDFSRQRNFALKQVTSKWALFVDSDEYVSERLKNEILRVLASNRSYLGYYLKRRDFFIGKELKHGETRRGSWIRLLKKGYGKWQGKVHEELRVKGPTSLLKEPLIHQRHMNLSQFLIRLNDYSSMMSKDYADKKRNFSYFELFFYPPLKFLKNYIIHLGFLDGMEGFIMVYMMSLHSLLVRAKQYQQKIKI